MIFSFLRTSLTHPLLDHFGFDCGTHLVYAKKEGKLEFFEHCVRTDLEQCNRPYVSLTRKVAFYVSSSALKSRNVFATDK